MSCGLDIGSYKAVVAVVQRGTMRAGIDVLTNRMDKTSTESIVCYSDKNRTIGEMVEGSSKISNFKNCITHITCLIGRQYDDTSVQDLIANLPFVCVKIPNGTVGVRVRVSDNDIVLSMEQVLASLLLHLQGLYKERVGSAFNECVMSIPGFFTLHQRAAMRDAAKIAGIKALSLVHNTTATALQHGYFKQYTDSRVVVAFLDMGFSSFECSIVLYKKNEMHVLCNESDGTCGGMHVDSILVDYMCKEIERLYNINPHENPRAMARLRQAVEKVKKTLSLTTDATLSLDSFMNDVDVTVKITRDKFDDLYSHIRDNIWNIVVRCLRAVETLNVRVYDIASVEIVGGSLRLVALQNELSKLFDKPLGKTLNMEECVARGCAVMSAIITSKKEYKIRELIPFELLLSWSPINQPLRDESVILPKTTELPAHVQCRIGASDSFVVCFKYGPQLPLCTWEIGPIPTSVSEALLDIYVSNDVIVTVKAHCEVYARGITWISTKQTQELAVRCVSRLGLDSDTINAYKNAELEMIASDNLVMETEIERYNLETYVYSMRDKIAAACATGDAASDMIEFNGMLTKAKDWLYDDTQIKTKDMYSSLLAKLRARNDEIERDLLEQRVKNKVVADASNVPESMSETGPQVKQPATEDKPEYMLTKPIPLSVIHDTKSESKPDVKPMESRQATETKATTQAKPAPETKAAPETKTVSDVKPKSPPAAKNPLIDTPYSSITLLEKWNGDIAADGKWFGEADIERMLWRRLRFASHLMHTGMMCGTVFAGVDMLESLLNTCASTAANLYLLLALELHHLGECSAYKYFHDYENCARAGTVIITHPLFLLAASRLADTDKTRQTCLSLFYNMYPAACAWLNDKEKLALNLRATRAEDVWNTMKLSGCQCDAVDQVMVLPGLEKVKQYAILLYKRATNTRNVSQSKTFLPVNLLFCGNPGTFKLKMAKRFGRILEQSVVECDVQKVKKEGIAVLRKEMNTEGCVLFVDNMHTLNPNVFDDLEIISELITMSEHMHVIFSGYGNGFVSRLFERNEASLSKFEQVVFDDFNHEELLYIWNDLLVHNELTAEPTATKTAIRRIARGSGKPGFGNANEVSKVMNAALIRAEKRSSFNITTSDVIGVAPLDDPKVVQVLNEFYDTAGWTNIKQQVRSLVEQAMYNYDREIEGGTPTPLVINRVFIGNTGTGRRTCAKLYGKLLESLCVLSSGDVVYTTANDYVGVVRAECEPKTNTLFESALGKVLVIDDAHNLSDKYVTMDTLVNKLQQASDNMAVVLIGNEGRMMSMFDQHIQLAQCFSLDHAFKFNDFTDVELLDIFNKMLAAKQLSVESINVKKKVIEYISRMRSLASFYNAVTVDDIIRTLVAKASKRSNSHVITENDINELFEKSQPKQYNDAGVGGVVKKEAKTPVKTTGLSQQDDSYRKSASDMKSKQSQHSTITKFVPPKPEIKTTKSSEWDRLERERQARAEQHQRLSSTTQPAKKSELRSASQFGTNFQTRK